VAVKRDPRGVRPPTPGTRTPGSAPGAKDPDRVSEHIRQLIKSRSGIVIDPHKDFLLLSRIDRRRHATGAASLSSYFAGLLRGESGEQELLRLIAEVTVNETYFFRDAPQLNCFARELLPAYLKARGDPSRPVRVWSAGCSTGDEPYSLAILLSEHLPRDLGWRYELEANDINPQVLSRARAGLYSARAVRSVPDAWRAQYFQLRPDGWQLDPRVAETVRFEESSLIDPCAMGKRRGYDFVFCRNVLIYFDDADRRRVIDFLYQALLPGGYLFLGHSESVQRLSSAPFVQERFGNQFCYRKPFVGEARELAGSPRAGKTASPGSRGSGPA
jgi:chemotaxis protein methyltransferase CheR